MQILFWLVDYETASGNSDFTLLGKLEDKEAPLETPIPVKMSK